MGAPAHTARPQATVLRDSGCVSGGPWQGTRRDRESSPEAADVTGRHGPKGATGLVKKHAIQKSN